MKFGRLLYQNIVWRGANLLSVFLLNILISRMYGAGLYGGLFFFINILALLLLVIGFSLESGLGFYTAQNRLKAVTAVGISAIWSVAGAATVLLLLQIYSAPMQQLQYKGLEVYCFLYAAGQLLVTFFSSLFNAKHQYVFPNTTAVLLNMIVAALLFTKPGFEAFIHIYFAATFIQGIILLTAYLIQYTKAAPAANSNNTTLILLLRYAAAAFIANLIFFLVYRVDYWFIDYFIKDKNALGNYIQVSRLGQMLLIIPGIISATVFSVTASAGIANVPQKVQQLSRIIFSAALVCCLLLAATGKWLFPALFGKSFNGMYQPFLLLAPGIIAIATLYPFTAYNAGSNAVIKNIYGSLFALAVIVAGDIIAVPIIGISGAALVSSMGYLTYFSYILYKFTYATGTSLKDNFILKGSDLSFIYSKVQ